mgnify:CR=1 FL=1
MALAITDATFEEVVLKSTKPVMAGNYYTDAINRNG